MLASALSESSRWPGVNWLLADIPLLDFVVFMIGAVKWYVFEVGWF
jgi:hypothetical protein